MKRIPFSAFAALTATPALAHPGEHHGLALGQALSHLLEPDHLAIATLVVLVGLLAWRARRVALAKRRATIAGRGERK